jgi:dTDP-4-amino-4,6-dideoxygalactose transaminase
VGLGSGTEALWLALLALGIGRGDEVITVPNSFFATSEAISWCAATPVFVDVDPETCTMDPAQLERAITPRTRAVIPVHLYGQCADMDPITRIARSRGLAVIEDACQAHGARYKGRMAGSLGDVAAFSFYPGKNLGAYGEAGAVTTSDRQLAERVRMLRDHGQRVRYDHDLVGINGRMDGIQGAILSVKLRRLEAWNAARVRHADRYAEVLGGIGGLTPPACAAYGRHIYHIYAVRVPHRDRVLQALKQEGVSCGVHYPIPIHLQKAYRPLGLAAGSFPVSENWAQETLSLPMYPELSDAQIQWVGECLRRALGAAAA